MKEIVFYRTQNGKSPVEDYLDTLNAKQFEKVAWVLRIIKELDSIPKEYFKK